MRIVLLFFFISFLSTGLAHSQTTKCNGFKNGTFKLIDNGHSTIIKRSGAEQSEFFDGAKNPTTYKVNWINDCTYVLTPNQDVFDKYPAMPKNAQLTVRIISTTDSSYTQVSASNFFDRTFTATVIKTN
jgi:hypothetical protein